jgi:hypothetical protein
MVEGPARKYGLLQDIILIAIAVGSIHVPDMLPLLTTSLIYRTYPFTTSPNRLSPAYRYQAQTLKKSNMSKRVAKLPQTLGA